MHCHQPPLVTPTVYDLQQVPTVLVKWAVLNSEISVDLPDASQLLDDLDMPELEDITYSDDDNDFGTEADFNNLETSITVNPIPTTRVHKDHHVSQIIGDLSSTIQTRSMTRVVKDQSGLL
nr:hypothetical protein [Tanacetum cinerariifolium]